jgi:hypothetical protein
MYLLINFCFKVIENQDTVFVSLGNSWIETLPSISKFAMFFPGVLRAILLFLSIYFFIWKRSILKMKIRLVYNKSNLQFL